jgi:hypothetical protein
MLNGENMENVYADNLTKMQSEAEISPLKKEKQSSTPIIEQSAKESSNFISGLIQKGKRRLSVRHPSPKNFSSRRLSPKNNEQDAKAIIAEISQRVKIIDELRVTEQKYLESLDVLNKTYLQDLSTKKIIQPISRELESLISILNIIVSFNTMLQKNLKEGEDIGKKFLAIIPFLKTYTDYFNCYERFCAVVKIQKKDNKKFTEWLEKTESKCRSNGGLSMSMYLIMPIQRIPRYNLLLKELLKHTEESHYDYENIKKALEGTVSVSNFLDGKILEFNNRKKFKNLMKQLMDNPEAKKELTEHTVFAHDGVMQFIEASELRISLNFLNEKLYFVLLHDKMITCKEVEEVEEQVVTKKYTFLFAISLHDLVSVGQVETLTFRFDVQNNNYTLQCTTEEEVHQWVYKMSKIKTMKEATKIEARTVNRTADKWVGRRQTALKLNVIKK